MHNISTGKNIGCSVCFYGFGAATSAVGVTAGASITRIMVFVCSGGQGVTVCVQSITALTCPCRSKSPFPKGSSTQSPALSRSGTHTGGVFPAPKQSNPLQTRTLQGIESSCPLLKKQIKNKYFSCLLFLTTTSNTATIIKHILTK